MWQIRRAKAEDRDLVLTLWEAVGLGKAEGDEWRAITSGSGAVLLVAEEDVKRLISPSRRCARSSLFPRPVRREEVRVGSGEQLSMCRVR